MKEVYDRWNIGCMNINITEKEIHERACINGERHGNIGCMNINITAKEIHERACINGERHGEIEGEGKIGERNWESGGESGERRERKREKDEDREIKIGKD